MKKYDFKVYVGCGLTHAPMEFRQAVEQLKASLSNVCQVLNFKGLSGQFTCSEIYEHDIGECVGSCDLMLAICDFFCLG